MDNKNKFETPERENIKDPLKHYDIKTFNKYNHKIFHKFNNETDYTNKIIFFNGTLGKIKTHNSKYLHYEAYERIYKKTINTSTIYYNDDEEKNYYKFIKTLEPLRKVLHSKFSMNSFIFEPDDDIFNKVFMTTKGRNGQDLQELIKNNDDLINDQFRTSLKYYINNVMSSINFSTNRSGELISLNALHVIHEQKDKLKDAFKLSPIEQIKQHIPFIFPIGGCYTKDYLDKIMNIIDEIKAVEQTKEEHRKEFIRINNEQYDKRKQEEEQTRQRQ